MLRAAIATCLRQSEPTLEILVSDNHSDDDTCEVVESFRDRRVRYVNPGFRLGMSEHWEFALGHVADGYVTVLGDDDGLLPGAVARARELIDFNGVRAVSWRKAEYHWPDHILPSARSWLHVPMRERVEVVQTGDMLRNVLSFRRGYQELPCIYNCFVATDILAAVRRRSGGKLLPCVTPDIYSGFAIALEIDRYAYSHAPLSVNGASRHSHGTIAVQQGVGAEVARRHLTSSSIKFHSSLAHCSSIPVLVADAALVARERLAPPDGALDLDWPAMLRCAAHYAQHSSPTVFAQTLAALDEIARRNQLIPIWEPIRADIRYRAPIKLQRPGWDADGTSLAFDGARLGLRDVDDAASFVGGVLRAAAKKTAAGRLDRRDILECLPVDLDPRFQAAQAKSLLQLNRPPSPLSSYLRRFWPGARRRLNGLRSRLTARS